MLLRVNARASLKVRDPHTCMGGGGDGGVGVVTVSVGMIGVSHSVSGTDIGWASFTNSRHSTTARSFTVQNIMINEIRL